MTTKRNYVMTLVIGFVIGALVQWFAMRPITAPEAAPRQGEKISENAVYAPRVADVSKAPAPEAQKPKGVKTKITDTAVVNVVPKADDSGVCPPVSVMCSVTEEEDGNRGVIFEVDGATITDSKHWQLEPGSFKPRSFNYEVSALAVKRSGEEWEYGARVGRNFGFVKIGAGMTPEMLMLDIGFRFN